MSQNYSLHPTFIICFVVATRKYLVTKIVRRRAVAVLDLIMWLASLGFVGVMWMSLEPWAITALRCYKQNLVGHFGWSLEPKKAQIMQTVEA